MFRLILSNVRHNRARYTATLVAIVVGVAFFAASGFVSDTIIRSLEGNVDEQFGHVAVAVTLDDSSDLDPQDTVVSESTAQQMAALDGVDGHAETLTAPVGFLDAHDKPFATDATGRLWVEDGPLNPLQLDQGTAPSAGGEIAVDKGLAKRGGFTVGQQVTLLTLAGPQKVTVVGVTKFGGTDAIDDGGTVSVSPADAFAWLANGQHQYQNVYLRGDDPQQILTEVKPLVPAGFTAVDGDTFRQHQRDSSGSIGRTIKVALQAFAVLALLVGVFVIYNTFTVIVAQRLRELAVLSAIGATGKQLKRSLRWEGVVVGLVGSVLGVVVGLVLAFGLVALLGALGGGALPGGAGLDVEPAPIVQGVVLGTLITVVSVLVPARRAARTEPIEAMREAAVESGTLPKGRLVVAIVLGVLGLLAMLAGGTAVLIGLGVVLFVVAVLVGAPYIALGGALLLHPFFRRRGIEGRLAVDNSIRNPKRTATTANALVIGVFLVTLVAVVGTTLKDFAVGQIQEVQSADYVVSSTGGTVDPTLVKQLEGVKGVDDVVPLTREPAAVDGVQAQVSSGDLAELTKVAAISTSSGDLGDLADGTIALGDTGNGKTPPVGSTVTVTPTHGTAQDLKVVAIVTTSLDSQQVGNLVSEGTFRTLFGDTAPTLAFVDVASGAESSTQDAIQDLADRRPDITVTEGNALGQLISSVFDFLINAVIGLLLMSVLVAVIGIINTMSLSILERRRELGLLRIIGMTDVRVRRMVRLESIVIALLGTLTGLVAGLVVSGCVSLSVNRLSDAHIAFHAPWLELVVILVLGIVLGYVAALVPARRSTRLSALDAVQAT